MSQMLFLVSLAEFVLACTRLPHKGIWVFVVLEEVEIVCRTAVWHTPTSSSHAFGEAAMMRREPRSL